MKKSFEKYLIDQGYSLRTPSGNPSTVYDYQKRIDKVCEWEGYPNWETLAVNISRIVAMYDVGGVKVDLGNTSHRAVINALKQFKMFLQQYYSSL